MGVKLTGGLPHDGVWLAQASTMELMLSVSFFASALGDSAVPVFDPDDPYQAGLLFEHEERPMGVEFLTMRAAPEETTSIQVMARTIGDTSSFVIAENSEFFVYKGGRPVGRGSVDQATT